MDSSTMEPVFKRITTPKLDTRFSGEAPTQDEAYIRSLVEGKKDLRHIRQGNHLLTLMKRLSMWS